MREPKTSFLSGGLQQAWKHLGSIRKAAGEYTVFYCAEDTEDAGAAPSLQAATHRLAVSPG